MIAAFSVSAELVGKAAYPSPGHMHRRSEPGACRPNCRMPSGPSASAFFAYCGECLRWTKDPLDTEVSNLLHCITASQRHCARCAPEEIRTPNLLIRSAKFTHSGNYYLALWVLGLPRRELERHPMAGVNGQFNGQDLR
jgi:hypothetical protein